MTDAPVSTFSPGEMEKFREWASVDFGPIKLAEALSEDLLQQHLFLFRSAYVMLGKTKAELTDFIMVLSESNGLHEMTDGLNDAAQFFRDAAEVCDAVKARLVIAGASAFVEPSR